MIVVSVLYAMFATEFPFLAFEGYFRQSLHRNLAWNLRKQNDRAPRQD